MSDVRAVFELERDTDGCCTVVADVDDVVLVAPQTYDDPAEYGAALCRGSFYLQDDEVIPHDDDDLCRFVADRIDTWEVLDLSDLYGGGEDAP